MLTLQPFVICMPKFCMPQGTLSYMPEGGKIQELSEFPPGTLRRPLPLAFMRNSAHSVRCHEIICPYLSASARSFYVTLAENEVLPFFVDFNSKGKFEFEYSEFSIIWRLNSFGSCFHVLIFSKYVKKLSISLEKSTEICWNILSTKLKIFCSEQLKITCNFTTLNTIAQNKNYGQ